MSALEQTWIAVNGWFATCETIKQMKKPFSIYSTWGLHDTLGDSVPLTEKTARAALDIVLSWKQKYGLKMDVFQIDYGWSNPKTGFLDPDPENWPNGIEPFLTSIRDADMVPGLWFSTNGGTMKVPEWEESLAYDNWHYSLYEGPFGEALQDAVLRAASEWGVRFFKFDFARFSARRNQDEPVSVAIEKSMNRFLEILQTLRAAHPNIYVIAHCGFARNSRHQNAGESAPAAADPSLLAAIDGFFSGDPTLGDLPTLDLCQGIDLYVDRAVWKLHQAGFPLHRIEDHGSVIGTTNTALYRGRSGFQRSHLMQLARGGERDLYYGDPACLKEEDLIFWRAARELFFSAWRRNLTSALLPNTIPGETPTYGWLTGGGHCGLLVVVNSSWQSQNLFVTMVNALKAKVIFSDSPHATSLQVQPDRMLIGLPALSMALIGLGEYSHRELLPSFYQANSNIGGIAPASLQWDSLREGFVANLEEGPPTPTSKLAIVARFWKGAPDDPYPLVVSKLWKQDNRVSRETKPIWHAALTLELRRNGREIGTLAELPDRPVYSGTSWIMRLFHAQEGDQLKVSWVEEILSSMTVEAYWVNGDFMPSPSCLPQR